MSVQAVKWVYEKAPEHSAAARAVLNALAWRHTPDEGAYPKRTTLVHMTRLSDGAVGRALRQLEAEGSIERAGARPGGGTIVWRFPAFDPPTFDPAPGARPTLFADDDTRGAA